MKVNRIVLSIFFSFSFHFATAQSLKSDSMFVPGGVKQYQFHLDKPVKSIEELRYEKTGEPIKGNLSPDGTRVVMDNYHKGSRVKMKVTYVDGTTEEIIKSSCFIDPVLYEL